MIRVNANRTLVRRVATPYGDAPHATRARSDSSTARRSVATHPRRSTRLSSDSDPPCASAICRQSTRPMPDPCGFVVKNGTKRFALFAKPGPSSSTITASVPFCRCHRMRTRAARLERCVDGVAHEIDQQLIELIAVGAHDRRRTRHRRATGIRVSSAATRRTHVPTSSGTLFGAGSRASRAYADMNRTSASERPPITVKPATQIVVGVRRTRLALEQRRETSGDRLDRRERVVDLVAEHAHESLPRLQLFFAQRLADVGEHEQRVRPSVLAKRSATHFPSPGAAGKRDVHRTRRRTLQTLRRARPARRFGRAAARPAGPSSRSPARFTRRNAIVVVEREHGDVDLRHHRAQQRRRLHRAEPLRAQRFAEQIRFEKGEPERVVAIGAARANRVVALAQRGEHVRQRLQRPNDALAQHERGDQPRADDERGRASTAPCRCSRRARAGSSRRRRPAARRAARGGR